MSLSVSMLEISFLSADIGLAPIICIFGAIDGPGLPMDVLNE